MRNLNNYFFSSLDINNRIKTLRRRTNSIIGKVVSNNGNFVNIELLKAQEGIKTIDNVPIIHSLNNYTAIEKGTYGILLNLQQSTAGFFRDEKVHGDFLDVPEYVFLPVIAKSKANNIKAENTYLSNANNQSSIMLDNQEGIKINSNQDINIQSNQNTEITSSMPLNLNNANIGKTLNELAQDLTTLQTALASKGIVWNATSLNGLLSIITKIK